MKSSIRGVVLAFVAVVGQPLFAEEAPTWPQWRGPNRDCKVPATTWPDALKGEHLEEMWRVELGPGYPGPIVTEDRVFVAETRDRKNEVVRALDRKTGKEIWTASWKGSMSVPFFARANGSWIRSTPAYDGESLYVAGMRDVLVCLNAKTGERRWRVDFVKRFGAPLPSFGFVCSPLVDGDAVYVQAGASLLKMNKKTGDTIWRSMKDGGGMYGSAFSSPTFATLEGKRQLLVQSRSELAGVEPESGKVLWSKKIKAFRGMNILTPMEVDGKVFTSAYGGNSHLFDITRDGDTWGIDSKWSNKIQAYMSSPVVIDGHAYVHLRNQRFCCVDLKTGEEKWKTKPYGQYWSMAVNGNKILALDSRGELYLIDANPEKFVLLDSKKISDSPTWGHLAISGDHIFVRELKAIVAYRWK